MERKIGEIFEHRGKQLTAIQTDSLNCINCYFGKENGTRCFDTGIDTGSCIANNRTDNTYVIFQEKK